MVVPVEPTALERDAHLGEDLLDRRATLVVVAVVDLRARGDGVVDERLPEFEHLSGALAAVVVDGHDSGGYRWGSDAAPYDERVILAVALVVGAYAIGMFPTAQLVGRRMGVDPTRHGSRNPGASNVYRLGGRRAGVAVGLIDMLKGAIPAGTALLVAGRPEAHAAWVAAVAGHVWPIARRLRGGKGVATAGGAGLVISPLLGLGCVLIFLVVVSVVRIAALGSLSIAISYPFLAAIVGRPGWEIVVSSGVASIVVIRHKSNIRRLVHRDGSRLDEDGRPAA